MENQNWKVPFITLTHNVPTGKVFHLHVTSNDLYFASNANKLLELGCCKVLFSYFMIFKFQSKNV